MDTGTMPISNRVHQGRNVRRFREMKGLKQEVLAEKLDISQSALSRIEQKDEIEDEMLEKIANELNVPVDAIKNFCEENATNIFANTFTDSFHDNASFFGYKPTFNPLDKVVELYERMLKAEQEKNVLLEKLLESKE